MTNHKMYISNYKEEKYHVKRYSYKYWIAVIIEISAILVWSIGLFEMFVMNGCNPANYFLHIGGLLFTIGSFLYAKGIQH
jgi:hypothetical protein